MRWLRLTVGVGALVAAAAMCVFGLWPQTVPRLVSVSARPSGVVVSPAVVDLGEVGQNEAVPFEFSLTNATGAEAKLIQVSKSCNCTEAVVGDAVLGPGQSTRVTATWRTGPGRGRKAMSVAAQFLARGAGGETVLVAEAEVRGTVRPDIEVTPERVVFGRGAGGVVRVEISPGRRRLPELVRASSSVPQGVEVGLMGTTLTVRRTDHGVPLDGHYVLVETTEAPARWLHVPLGERLD